MSEDIYTGMIGQFFEGGWRIAPFIKSQGGYIGVKAWPTRAATNHDELQKLVDEHAKKSNRQLIYGVVPSKGRYVVDIDTKKNADALQLWKEKVVKEYADPKLAYPSLVVKTKSGGYHLYYSNGDDKQLHSPTSVFDKDSGIDIRGFTGMVVMPTSIGTEDDWYDGEYTVIRGRPTTLLTVLDLHKVLGKTVLSEMDQQVKTVLYMLNEALRNDTVSEAQRYKLIPDHLVIPNSNRDNTLFRAARLCRMAGLSQDAAGVFMLYTSTRCEVTDEEPAEYWAAQAADKVKRVYSSSEDVTLSSVSALFEELDNAGTVLLRGVAKTYFYFRHASPILRLEARSKYSSDNIGNVLQGKSIETEKGLVPVNKVIGSYEPKHVAYGDSMYPKSDMEFFKFEDQTYVNTYYDPFATFEPNPTMLAEAQRFVQVYKDYILHMVGGDEEDAAHLTDKLAWIIQKPYRRLPTATIIYSHTRGSGKDVFMGLFREIVGYRFYAPMTLRSFESDHVDLNDKLVCVCSEVQLQANARGSQAAASFMGQIKDTITAKYVTVNPKFIQPFKAPIFTNFFLLSNFELSSLIEPGDRRFDIFHASETKLDQNRFGELADVTTEGLWLERDSNAREFRKHIVYALRTFLMEREISAHFDREEAKMNQVKTSLLEHQAPPAMVWMYENLPGYFTEEVVMMATHFCPLRIDPSYALKNLKEYYGADIHPLYRGERQIYRMNNPPALERKDDGSGRVLPILNMKATGGRNNRKPVYIFASRLPPGGAPPGEAWMRTDMVRWYEAMLAKFYGNVTTLPGQKPDADQLVQ